MRTRRNAKHIIGAGSLVLPIAGSLVRRYRARSDERSVAEDDRFHLDFWVRQAKDWLRANEAPDRVKAALDNWLAEGERRTHSSFKAAPQIKHRRRLFTRSPDS